LAPNKNRIIQIFQAIIGITKFSLLITFYLDWGFILVRHRQASIPEALINQWLQTDFLTNSTEVINASWNNYNSLSIKANNQFRYEIQYITKFSIDRKIHG
jgi:hypothetical protein